MGARSTHRGRAGFTLVEILLALAVMGIVLAAAHEVLTSTVKQTDAVWQSAGGRAAVGTLAQVLRADLADLYPLEGEEPPLALSLPLGVAGSGEELSFATAAEGLDLPQRQAPQVRRVVYRLQGSRAKPGTYALYRTVHPYPGERHAAEREMLLADGLQSFEAEAFDGSQWQSRWPPADTKGLPRAVRVRFELDGRQVSLIVAVEVAAPPQKKASG